jgi:3-oxoadipate enol-lactonase
MLKNDFAEVGGAKFYYEIAGEGPSLVLLHAGIADGRMWDEQFQVFAKHYHVLRYDRRGFGKTEMVAGTYSHHSDLYELLKYLQIRQATLVGCSQGAKIAVDFTLEHPDMTDALVLVAPALSGFAYTGDMPRQAEQIDLAEEAGDLVQINELELQIWVDGPYRTPDQVDAQVRERVREMNLIALQTPDGLGREQPLEPAAAGRLAELHTQTLVIVGDLDTPKTLAAAGFLAIHIAGARMLEMTGTAHLPNMERSDEFNRHVLSFLG